MGIDAKTFIEHKRGDSLDRMATIPAALADGSFVGWTVASQIRDPTGKLIATLDASWVDAETTRTLRLQCFDTTGWPITPAELDVQFTRDEDGFTLSTKTAVVHIVRDVTRLELSA